MDYINSDPSKLTAFKIRISIGEFVIIYEPNFDVYNDRVEFFMHKSDFRKIFPIINIEDYISRIEQFSVEYLSKIKNYSKLLLVNPIGEYLIKLHSIHLLPQLSQLSGYQNLINLIDEARRSILFNNRNDILIQYTEMNETIIEFNKLFAKTSKLLNQDNKPFVSLGTENLSKLFNDTINITKIKLIESL